MTNLTQTPVPIGPIPVDVIRVPETGDSLYLFIISVLLFLIFKELRKITRNTRREP